MARPKNLSRSRFGSTSQPLRLSLRATIKVISVASFWALTGPVGLQANNNESEARADLRSLEEFSIDISAYERLLGELDSAIKVKCQSAGDVCSLERAQCYRKYFHRNKYHKLRKSAFWKGFKHSAIIAQSALATGLFLHALGSLGQKTFAQDPNVQMHDDVSSQRGSSGSYEINEAERRLANMRRNFQRASRDYLTGNDLSPKVRDRPWMKRTVLALRALFVGPLAIKIGFRTLGTNPVANLVIGLIDDATANKQSLEVMHRSWTILQNKYVPPDRAIATELAFAEHYPRFSEAVRNSLKKALLDAKSDQDSTTQLIDYVQRATRLPFGIKPLELQLEYLASRPAFSYFSKPIQDEIGHFLFRQMLRAFERVPEGRTEDLEKEKNIPSYWTGRPGTGKTLAAQLVAAELGVPLAQLSLAGASIESLVGTSRSALGGGSPGLIVEALTAQQLASSTHLEFGSQPPQNLVLFIDEFDRVANSTAPGASSILGFLLELLDPDSQGFYNPYYDAIIKLPSTIILAGNHPIMDEALADRFDTVYFEGFTKAAKIKMMRESMVPRIIARIHSEKTPIVVSDLTPDDWRQLEALVDEIQQPGVRQLEIQVQKALERICMQRWVARTAG